MITKQQAVSHSRFYHLTARNADGSAVRCRRNGRCKTWVTRPDDYRLPVKYRLKRRFYITPDNAHDWSIYDLTDLDSLCLSLGLVRGSDPLVVADYLEEVRGMHDEARVLREAYAPSR